MSQTCRTDCISLEILLWHQYDQSQYYTAICVSPGKIVIIPPSPTTPTMCSCVHHWLQCSSSVSNIKHDHREEQLSSYQPYILAIFLTQFVLSRYQSKHCYRGCWFALEIHPCLHRKLHYWTRGTWIHTDTCTCNSATELLFYDKFSLHDVCFIYTICYWDIVRIKF